MLYYTNRLFSWINNFEIPLILLSKLNLQGWLDNGFYFMSSLILLLSLHSPWEN